ncbi:MAG: DUF480 domain-containing protein [Thermoanaerobaculia bacterium]
MFRVPRLLDAVECRVLGALLEKEQATPEYYPLTVAALHAACNQKTNREPVLELAEAEIEAALARLFADVLVWRSPGARATRWSHNLDRRWELSPAAKAVVTLLLLRGPQTVGELRGRSDRLHAFATLAEVEATLDALAAGNEPLVELLPRSPGQKEARWRHLLGEAPDHTVAEGESAAAPSPTPRAAASGLEARLAALEARVAALEAALKPPTDGGEA